MVARASSFAAEETASGLAHLPGFELPEYGLLCLQERLALMVPMHRSMFSWTGECFCFRAPMHSAVLA
jgi:hypothetical protein